MPLTKNPKQSSLELKNPQEIKIKSLLLSKIEREDNPQIIVDGLEGDIAFHLEKMQEEIQKQTHRIERIKKVEEIDLKTRNSLRQKLDQKMSKILQTKQKKIKAKVQAHTKQRKLREELIAEKKKQIKDEELKNRLEKFKNYQSVNQKQHIIEKSQHIANKNGQKINRYSSQEHLRRSKELQEYEYYKVMELLNKKKVFQKTQKPIKRVNIVNKSEIILKIKQVEQQKKLKMLAEDLQHIEQARKKKEKQIKAKCEKNKKQEQLSQQLRSYRVQGLKEESIKKLVELKQKQKKKNQQFILHKNSSTSNVLDTKRYNSSKSSRSAQKFGKTLSTIRIKVESMHNLTQEESRKRDLKQKLRKEIQGYVKIKKHFLLSSMH